MSINETGVEVISTRVIAGFMNNETLIDKALLSQHEDENGFVTLQQVRNIVIELLGEGVIDVWYEMGLFGYIYRYTPNQGWSRHGETRGFA